MKVSGVDYTFFAVSDMQRSLAFYRDLLGIPLARLILDGTWAEFEMDPGALVLGHGDSFTRPGGGAVALAVDDAEAALEELKRAGVRVYWDFEETPVCYMAIVEDPDGNRIIIHQRKGGEGVC